MTQKDHDPINIIAKQASQEFGVPIAPGGKPFLNFATRERFANNLIKALEDAGYYLYKEVD